MTAYPLPSIQNYENFDLLIDPTADGYQARVINSPVGQAITQFNLDVRISDQSDPKQVGALLYQTVFSGNVGTHLRRSLDAVAQQPNSGLRIRLRLTTVPELATLPWETLYNAERNLFFALSAQTPLVRYQELDQRELPLQAALPLRLLVLISDPVDFWPRLDGEHEWQQLHSAMADLVARGKVQIERLPARLDLLQQRMQQSPMHLLHFIGHGWYDNADRNGLIMETENGQADRVAVERLTALLHDHAALRLVFLNACEGARGDHTNAFAGVAQRLVQQGIPAVIAMQKEVSDQSAIALTQTFYQALAAGSPVDAALAEARKAIFAIGNNHEWSTPALFSRAVNNRLFDLLDVLPPPPCPYPGMVPFTKNDARFFFGREDEIAELHRRLRHHNQLFVIGPSGSGKSSLVFAGLLPELEKQSITPWHISIFRPGATPLTALNEALADRSVVAEATTTASTDDPKFLLVIDQFEELFVQASKADQTTFIARVKALYQEQQVKLLITMRADFYPDLMNSDLWPIDVSQRLEIAPLRGEKLRQAIEQPAANVGVRLEAGLLERLLADAADEPGVLPLLQETMVLLWEGQERRVLPMAAYTRLGQDERSGLAVAMSTKADATLASLTLEQQVIARRIFLRLVQFGEGRPNTRRQQVRDDLTSKDEDLSLFMNTLHNLAQNRLITLTAEAKTKISYQSAPISPVSPKVDIAHEMLISQWPRVQQWIKEYRDGELMRRRLEEKATEWQRLGGGDNALLDAAELAEANPWLTSANATDLGYSGQIEALIRRSEQTIQRRKCYWRLTLAVLAILLIIAVSIGVWGRARQLDASRQAEIAATKTAEEAQQQAIARSRALANESQQYRTKDPMRSWLLAIEAGRKAETVEAFNVLQPQWQIPVKFIRQFVQETGISDVIWSNDKTHFLTLNSDNSVGVWATRDNKQLFTLQHEDKIAGAVWNSDGSRILSWSDDKSARVWDARNGQQLLMMKHNVRVGGAQWNHKEDRLLTWTSFGGDYDVRLWDAINGQQLLTLPHNDDVNGAQWNRDESRILTRGRDYMVRLWDAQTGQQLLALLHDDVVYGAQWNKDESRILSWSEDGTARIWNAQSGEQLFALNHDNGVFDAQWNSTEDQILTTCRDKIARIWDPETGRQLFFLADEFAESAQWYGNDHDILTVSPNNTATIWNADSSLLPIRDVNGVYGVAWNSAENLIFTWSAAYMVRLWNTHMGTQLFAREYPPPSNHAGLDNELSFEDTEIITISFAHDNSLPSNPTQLDNGFSFEDGGITATWPFQIKLSQRDSNDIIIEDTVLGAQWNTDERYILIWDADKTIHVLDAITGEPQISLSQDANVLGAQWNVEGDSIISWSDDSVVRVWDAQSGKQLFLLRHDDVVHGAQWNAKGNQILTWSADTTAQIWDANSGQKIRKLQHTSRVNGAAWDQSEQHILTWGEDGTLHVWAAVTAVELFNFQYKGNIDGAQWSDNGDQILVWGKDDDVRLWDIKTNRYLMTFPEEGRIVHSDWNGDRSLIFTWREDNIVHVWNTKTGVLLMTISNETRADDDQKIRDVRWSRDAHELLLVTEKGYIYHYLTQMDDLLIWACERVTRNLTRSEWQQFLPGEPYQLTCPQ